MQGRLLIVLIVTLIVDNARFSNVKNLAISPIVVIVVNLDNRDWSRSRLSTDFRISLICSACGGKKSVTPILDVWMVSKCDITLNY